MCLRISYYQLSKTQGYDGIDTLNQFHNLNDSKNVKEF